MPHECADCGKPATHVIYTRLVSFEVPLRDGEEQPDEEVAVEASDWTNRHPACEDHRYDSLVRAEGE